MSAFAWVMALWIALALVLGSAFAYRIHRGKQDRRRAEAALPPLSRRQPGAHLDDAGLRRLAVALTRKEN